MRGNTVNGITKIVKIVGRTYVLVPLIVTIFGTYFAVVTPPLWGIDETAHFERTYQISQGGLLAEQKGEEVGGMLPKNIPDLHKTVIMDLTAALHLYSVFDRKDVRDPNVYTPLVDVPPSATEEFVSFAGSAAYSPIAYAAPSIAVTVFDALGVSLGGLIIMARLACLLVFVALITLALRSVDALKIKWLVVAIILIPKVVYQASIVSVDGILNGLGILLFALFIKSLITKNLAKYELILLAVVAIVLPLIKVNYSILSLLILLVPVSVYARHIPYRKWAAWAKWIIVAVAAVLAGIWLLLTRHVGTALGQLGGYTSSQVNPGEQLQFVLHQPGETFIAFIDTLTRDESNYVASLLSMLGWNYVQTPVVTMLLSVILLVIVAFYAREELLKAKKVVLISAGVALVCVLSVFAIMYLTFNPIGANIINGVQGRYFLPMLAFIISGVTVLIPLSLQASKKTLCILVISISVVLLLVAAVYYTLATH
jgi:uncharacterized membrane protein